jgi:ribosomal protein S18 acetylase RimI-like enzyme
MKLLEAPASFDRGSALELMRLADDSEQEIREYLFLGRLFLLRDDKRGLVGQVLVLCAPDASAEIKSVSILTSCQRQGLGNFLVKEVLKTLKSEGFEYVMVGTATADIGNIVFYQKIGFRCLRIDRDAFSADRGYPQELQSHGIKVRDKLWLDLDL